MQEVFNTPEYGFPILWRVDGLASIDGQDCVVYEEYQWIPKRFGRLLCVVYAPYSNLPNL